MPWAHTSGIDGDGTSNFNARFTKKSYDRSPSPLLYRGEKAVGTVSLQKHPGHLQFGEFYILSEHQGRGLGSRVLQHCFAIADQERLPVHLEHLIWNPVGSLYRRNGFIETSVTDSDFILKRPCPVGNERS